MSKEKKSLAELNQLELTDDIKIVCPVDKDLWLVFTRDMTRKQWKRFQDVLEPPDPETIAEAAVKEVGEADIPADIPDDKAAELLESHLIKLAEEIEKQRNLQAEKAAEDMYTMLSERVSDGSFTCDDKTYKGIGAIVKAAKNEDLTFVAEGFLISAISEAAKRLRQLGNAQRVN